MFIDIKLKTVFKIFIILIICFCILLMTSYITKNTTKMTNKNYTSILKEYHENPYKYEHVRIKTSGYIFRTDDFDNNQFVIARDMLVNNNEYQIVGFLCESENAENFGNNEWIVAEGVLYVGNYYGPMPIIKIKKFNFTSKPEDAFVLPPNKKGVNY